MRHITIPTITPTTHATAALFTIGKLIARGIPPAAAPAIPPMTAAFLFILFRGSEFYIIGEYAKPSMRVV